MIGKRDIEMISPRNIFSSIGTGMNSDKESLRLPVSIIVLIISIIFVFADICLAGTSHNKTVNGNTASSNTVSKSVSQPSQSKLDAGKIKDANELYEKGKYKEALSAYTEAGADNPQHPILNYNIGNVLYKTGRFENAVEKYNIASGFNSSIYNIGNSLYKMKKLQEALAAYKQAIIKNPDDLDAKFNYEYTSRLLQQQNQKGNQKQDQQKKDDQKQKDKQKQDQKDKKQGDQQQTKEEQKQIDPKQAESMLQALQQKEKDLMKKLQKEKQVKVPKTKKDW
jgi:Ca-activated chloride channel family protein